MNTFITIYLTLGIFMASGLAARLIGDGVRMRWVIPHSIACVFLYPIPVGKCMWDLLHGNSDAQLQRRRDILGGNTR